MEIYVETPREVTIPLPFGFESVTYTITRNGVTSAPANPASQTTTSVNVKVPYAQTIEEGEGVINVSFTMDNILYTGDTAKKVPFDVVTPYLTLTQARVVLDDDALTDDEVMEIEQAVRYIINAHCGQSFGKRTKDVIVVGAGETALALPERLMTITGLKTLSAVLNPSATWIVADGWYLKKKYYDAVSDIANTSIYWDGEGVYADETFPTEAPHGLGLTPDRFGHGEIISAPGSFSGAKWKDDYPFTISGTWGYPAVPPAVVEAAKLLMNDYACSEQAYRDRYLDSIKSADWRLQFNDKAFLNTGNVRADQLLNDYVMKRGWAVI
jgi:hypothetical protein